MLTHGASNKLAASQELALDGFYIEWTAKLSTEHADSFSKLCRSEHETNDSIPLGGCHTWRLRVKNFHLLWKMLVLKGISFTIGNMFIFCPGRLRENGSVHKVPLMLDSGCMESGIASKQAGRAEASYCRPGHLPPSAFTLQTFLLGYNHVPRDSKMAVSLSCGFPFGLVF